MGAVSDGPGGCTLAPAGRGQSVCFGRPGRGCSFAPVGAGGTAGFPRGIPPPFSFVLTKENGRGQSKRKNAGTDRRGRLSVGRGSCELVRWVSMAPSSLRHPLALEAPGPRITTAVVGRGGHRICLYFCLRALRAAPVGAAPQSIPLGEGGRRRRTDEGTVRPPHAAHRGGRAAGASSPFILSIRYLFFPKAPLRGQPCRSHPR